jgi:hypothetical protein
MKKGEALYLLAYPRSGSNWISYCLEITSSVVTVGVSDDYLCQSVLPCHREDVFVARSHGHRQKELSLIESSGRPLVFALRNYMESILRHNPKCATAEDVEAHMMGGPIREENPDYICLLDFFHRYGGPKHLVYYSDLIMNPRQTLENLLVFLRLLDNSKLESFMEEYEKHVARSIQNYRDFSYSDTEGKPELLLYHSNRISREVLVKVDRWLEENHNELYHTYLEVFKPINVTKDIT